MKMPNLFQSTLHMNLQAAFKKIIVIVCILLSSLQVIEANTNVSSTDIENWVREEFSNCNNGNQQLSLLSYSANSNFYSLLRAPSAHPNGWYYPAGSNNYQYLGWLGYNSAFSGYHLAQDMANPEGDPVYAIDSGDVIYSSTCVGGYGGPSGATCGGALVIQHRAKDGTWFTALYGHLNSPLPVGRHVYAGDYVGYSNNWNPPHVHFAVRIGYNPPIADNDYYRGYTSNTNNLYGFTNPISFLDSYSACRNGSSVNFRPSNNTPVHPNGTLIKSVADSTGTVYLIRNGQKQGIVSADVLRNLYPNGGFDFKDVITIAQDEFDRYPAGSAITSQLPSNGRTHSEGRLIRRSTGGEISIVTDNGIRRPFVSADVFLSLGYLFCNVVDAIDTNYDSYTAGSPITGLSTGGSTISVTVGTNPVGGSFSVDGTIYTSAQTFSSWIAGQSHTIATTSPQVSGNTRWVWNNWSDGGAISHTVAPTSNTTYIANFTTQYYLTMNAGTGGTASPQSSWYNSGQSVSISANPNSGYTFSGWIGSGSGSYTGANNPASVIMNAPITQTTSFSQSGQAPSVTTNSASAITTLSVTLNGGVNPNGSVTNAWFEWSTSSNFSSFNTTSSQNVGSGSTNISISANLTDIVANTAYYFRVGASNSIGTSKGAIQSFTTASAPSAPTLNPPSNLTATGVTLSWTSVTGATDYRIQISTNSIFNTSADGRDCYNCIPDGNQLTSTPTTSYSLNNLSSGTTYYWRVRAGRFTTISEWTTGWSFISSFTPTSTSSAPILLTEENSNRAIALDSVTFVRDPFPILTNQNFSFDGHTRIMLFAVNVDLLPGEAITAQAEDSQQRIFNLPAEYNGKVPVFDWLTQVTVRLPDELTNAGDVRMSISFRGTPSNKVLVGIRPSVIRP